MADGRDAVLPRESVTRLPATSDDSHDGIDETHITSPGLEEEDTGKKIPATTSDSRATPSAPSQFRFFTKLPAELRHLIWREAYQDILAAEKCVCIYKGGTIPAPEPRKSWHVWSYDLSLPVVYPGSTILEYVNHEARKVAASYGVPSRKFSPQDDILYIDRGKRHGDGSTIVFYVGDRTEWIKDVRHLALPYSLAPEISRHPSFLQHLKSLEKISFVFPFASGTILSYDHIAIPKPARNHRVKLRTLEALEMSTLTIQNEIHDSRRGRSSRDGIQPSAQAYIEDMKRNIESWVGRADTLNSRYKHYWSKDGDLKFDLEGTVFD